jgi:hypothetical protein
MFNYRPHQEDATDEAFLSLTIDRGELLAAPCDRFTPGERVGNSAYLKL